MYRWFRALFLSYQVNGSSVPSPICSSRLISINTIPQLFRVWNGCNKEVVFTDTLKIVPVNQTICFKKGNIISVCPGGGRGAREGGIHTRYSQGSTSLYRFLSKFWGSFANVMAKPGFFLYSCYMTKREVQNHCRRQPWGSRETYSKT